MEREELLVAYRKFLCAFCKESAHMEDMDYRISRKRYVSKREMEKHFIALQNCREALIGTKEKLGFGGGVDFTANCAFQGFWFANGHLFGDYTRLPDVIRPWIEEFEEASYFTYEVGMLLLFHFFQQKKRRRKERVREFFARLCAPIFFYLGKWEEE